MHLWLQDGQGREADLRAVRAAKEAKHDQCSSRSAGMVPVVPMLELWFDKDPAPAPPAPSTLDGAAPVVYTRDSWKPFERPGGCTYHVLGAAHRALRRPCATCWVAAGFSRVRADADQARDPGVRCVVVLVKVGAELARLETQVAKALEIGKPLVMVHDVHLWRTNQPLPGCACCSTRASLPAGYDRTSATCCCGRRTVLDSLAKRHCHAI